VRPPRNVPDDVLTRVRDSDGIVMVNFAAGFLNEECREWIGGLFAERERLAQDFGDRGPEWYRAQAAWLQANPRPPCEVSDVADHIEQVRKVAGVDHVGLGSDFTESAAAEAQRTRGPSLATFAELDPTAAP
jgi:membrane dipeptidase